MSNRIADPCEVCGKTFNRKYRRKGARQRFCSKSCRYKAIPKEIRQCKTCGKEFPMLSLGVTRKHPDYCSLACIQRSPCQLCGLIITGRAKFQGGERRFCSRRCANLVNRTLKATKEYVAIGFAQTIKRLGRLACERCGFDAPGGLTVHHLDSDRRNNSPGNLLTLCANCHAIEHWGNSLKRAKDVLVAQFIAKYA